MWLNVSQICHVDKRSAVRKSAQLLREQRDEDEKESMNGVLVDSETSLPW